MSALSLGGEADSELLTLQVIVLQWPEHVELLKNKSHYVESTAETYSLEQL